MVLVRGVDDDARVAGRLGVGQSRRITRPQCSVHSAVDPSRMLLVGVTRIRVPRRVVVIVSWRRR